MTKFTYTTFDEILARLDLAIMSKTPITGDERGAIFSSISLLMKAYGAAEATPLLCRRILAMGQADIKKFQYTEKSVWDSFYTFFAFKNITMPDKRDDLDFIEAKQVYEDEWKTMCSTILQLCYDTLALPRSNSGGSLVRREKAWDMIFEILICYPIHKFQNYVTKFLQKDFHTEWEPVFRSVNLYFEIYTEEIEDTLLQAIRDIFAQTTEEDIAIRCLKIQIDAGVIDEDTADQEMNGWEERLAS